MSEIDQDLRDLGQRLWPDAANLRPQRNRGSRDERRSVLSSILVGTLTAVILAAVLTVGLMVERSRTPAGSAITTPALTTPAAGPTNAPSPSFVTGNQPRPFTIPGVPACLAADLDVTVRVENPSYIGAGPYNTSSWGITVKDAGPRPCFVGPTPDVSFYGANGLLAVPKTQPWPGDIVYLSPDTQPAPPYFGSAIGEIDVSPCHLQPVENMIVDFGQTLGSVHVSPGPAGGFGTACPVAQESYFTELYGLPNSGDIGGVVPTTQATIVAPSTAHPGERLSFLVTVENTPGEHSSIGTLATPTPNPSMTFNPCPMYYEEIEGIVGTFHISELNCASVKPIPGGGKETFVMYIDIPADAHPGPATLIWSIDGSPVKYEIAHNYLQIT